MNKNSTFDFERQRELRLVKCNTASEREWTYEGERTRKNFSVSSNRRGVPVTARSVCSYATKVDLQKVKFGWHHGRIIVPKRGTIPPFGLFCGVTPHPNLSIFCYRFYVRSSFPVFSFAECLRGQIFLTECLRCQIFLSFLIAYM